MLEPIAKVRGTPFQIPLDLFIPPDALEIMLASFEGPMDVLLYLIKKANIDILDIPIAQITTQYMAYLDVMQAHQFELAAEYLTMAAWLAEIKSRLLLPRPPTAADTSDEDIDPRAELVRRLQAYERYRLAALNLDQLPRMERDIFAVNALLPELESRVLPAEVSLDELLQALRGVFTRSQLYTQHTIYAETLSVRGQMSYLMDHLHLVEYKRFELLFNPHEGRLSVVVTFMALLEMIKRALVELVQEAPFLPIHVRLLS